MYVESPTEKLGPGTSAVRALFGELAWRSYLDTASYGLPPLATIAALERALQAWQNGTANWRRDWDLAGNDCRLLASGLIGAPTNEISLLPSVSAGVASIAASLRPGDEVLVPDDEFRSVLFPLLVAEQKRGVRIRRVPFGRLADSVQATTTLVATSHVRSNGGGLQDLEAVASAAREYGAQVLVDATHSAGVLQIDSVGLGLHYVVAAAYKHLLCPRGVAFMRISPDCWSTIDPWGANWRSAASPYESYYGGTLEMLAPDAARFDLSLAWHAWVGARESLKALTRTDARERERYCVGLATAAADALGVQPTGSSILAVPIRTTAERAREALEAAGIAVGFPAGQARLSFHIYNSVDDVSHACSALERII